MFRIHDFTLEYESLKLWLRAHIQKDRSVYDFKDLSVFICISILLIFFTASAYWMLTEVVLILSPFFNDCKHSMFPCIFCYNRTFFRGRFCKKSYWNQIKNSRILSLKNDRTSFKTFVSRTFFPEDFFSTKI